MEAIMIIGHGSRSSQARDDFERVIHMVKERLQGFTVMGAHMENAHPNIPDTVEKMVSQIPNLRYIKVIPYFLYSGIHIKEDIPEILETLEEKYSEIQFKMGNAIGAEEVMADILLKRISEIS